MGYLRVELEVKVGHDGHGNGSDIGNGGLKSVFVHLLNVGVASQANGNLGLVEFALAILR